MRMSDRRLCHMSRPKTADYFRTRPWSSMNAASVSYGLVRVVPE
jgi:hypothetical protein